MSKAIKNSYSFNKLLEKLDELGAKANYIDECIRRGHYSLDTIRWFTTTPFLILFISFDWGITKDGGQYWARVASKLE